MNGVAEAVADAIVTDGYLLKPEELLQSLRSPAGRQPSEASVAVSHVLSKLPDGEALALIRAVLDAATFSFLTLLDHDFKNSGVHARFVAGAEALDSSEANGRFHEAYRNRVDPMGIPARASRAGARTRVEGTTFTTSAGKNA